MKNNQRNTGRDTRQRIGRTQTKEEEKLDDWLQDTLWNKDVTVTMERQTNISEYTPKLKQRKPVWHTKKCKEIEDYETKHDLFDLHKQIDKTGSNRGSPTQYMETKNGNKIKETQPNSLTDSQEKIFYRAF